MKKFKSFTRAAFAATSSGFTLIEVMAALIIISLGMMAVIQAVSQTANNSAYLRDKSVAHWVAMNRVTEMRLTPQPPPTGETAGEVEMGGKRWRWSAQVTQTDVKTMRRIDVGVSPSGESKGLDEQSQYAAITGFYGEKIAQPGTVTAQFDAPPAPTGNPNPQNPGQPKVPLQNPNGTNP